MISRTWSQHKEIVKSKKANYNKFQVRESFFLHFSFIHITEINLSKLKYCFNLIATSSSRRYRRRQTFCTYHHIFINNSKTNETENKVWDGNSKEIERGLSSPRMFQLTSSENMKWKSTSTTLLVRNHFLYCEHRSSSDGCYYYSPYSFVDSRQGP